MQYPVAKVADQLVPHIEVDYGSLVVDGLGLQAEVAVERDQLFDAVEELLDPVEPLLVAHRLILRTNSRPSLWNIICL